MEFGRAARPDLDIAAAPGGSGFDPSTIGERRGWPAIFHIFLTPSFDEGSPMDKVLDRQDCVLLNEFKRNGGHQRSRQ
jgi:hypothetical protein